MTNTPEKSPEAQKALERALTKWRGAGYPVDYSCRVKQPNGGTIHVCVYHHETFPLGGQVFVADVRAGEDRLSPLLMRRRISLVNGIVSSATVPMRRRRMTARRGMAPLRRSRDMRT